jgi:hypothetical protein
MPANVHPSVYTSFAIAALVLWRMYARVRRVIGRQQLSTVRPWLTVTLFPLLFALFAVGATMSQQPMAIVALLVGASLGVALGIIGHRLTTFEVTPQGLFYTPNAHLGIALSLLLVGRIAWRYFQISMTVDTSATGPGAGFVSSPLTLLIFGTLAGYYVSYAIGLLRWQRQVRADAAVMTESQSAAIAVPGEDGRIG